MNKLLALAIPSIFGNVETERRRRIYPKKPRKTFVRNYRPKKSRVYKTYPKYQAAPVKTMPVRFKGRRVNIMTDPRNVVRRQERNIKKVGTVRLKTQFIPTTYYAYKNSLRTSWNYLRNS
jgi:hypothetical protein